MFAESNSRALIISFLAAVSSWIAISESGGLRVPAPLMLTALLAISALALRRRKAVCAVVIILGVALINSWSRVTVLGDVSWFQIAQSDEKTLWASSAGGHAILRTVVQNGMNAGLVAPLCGVMTAGLLVWRALCRVDERGQMREVVLAVVAGTLPIFSRDFIEVTPIGFPVAVAAFVFADDSPRDRRMSIRQTTSLMCAGGAVFMHGVYLLVVIFLCMREVVGSGKVRRWQCATLAAFFPAVTVAFLVMVTYVSGFRFVAGDSMGGGDGRILPTDVLWPDHLKQTFMLLVVGSVLGLLRIFGAVQTRIGSDSLIAFSLFGGFLLLWNFDLGWVRDLDLVWAASVLHLSNCGSSGILPAQRSSVRRFGQLTAVLGFAAYSSLTAAAGWQMVLWKVRTG